MYIVLYIILESALTNFKKRFPPSEMPYTGEDVDKV